MKPFFVALLAVITASQAAVVKRQDDTLNGKFVAAGKKFWASKSPAMNCSMSESFTQSSYYAEYFAENEQVLAQQFGGVTPENSMKWDATEPSQNQFNFGNADQLVDWAVSNNKQIRGHTLVWHSQLPSWVSSISDAGTLVRLLHVQDLEFTDVGTIKTSVIQNHISNVAGRYAGKLYAVSKHSGSRGLSLFITFANFCDDSGMLSTKSSMKTELFGAACSQTSWERTLLQSPSRLPVRRIALPSIIIFFNAVEKLIEVERLYINDYNLDSANAKLQGLVNLVNRVNGGGTQLIDGIGTQTHLGAGGAGGVAAALALAASAGVEVAITELDIAGASPDDYVTVAQACLNEPACVSITSWGVSDVNSWRSGDSPLLFDGSYQPKPAFDAVLAAL
ncbi:hypothetical protein VNI00_006004 [Paramarasmius palmivorus]|uniref:Beta-xylanase n=1 Tax=Paramarasmius palmivorus TaxID=297713 RepID=A0AAW0DG02_9AGAR